MPRRVASWWRAAEEKRRARSHPSTPAPRRLCCTRGHPRGRGSGRAPCRPSPRRPRGERGAVLGSWSRGQLLSHHQHHHRTSKLWWSIAGGLRDGSASDRGKEADLDPGPATEDPPSPSSTLSRSARSPSRGALALWPHTPRKKSGKHFQKYCVRKILVLTIAFAPKGIT